jgi:hypothetical protein
MEFFIALKKITSDGESGIGSIHKRIRNFQEKLRVKN